MKDIQAKSHSSKTNGIIEYSDPKLKIYNLFQEALNLEWQSMPTNLTLKIWHVSAFRTNIPIKHKKTQHFDLNGAMNSNPKISNSKNFILSKFKGTIKFA